MIVCSIEDMLFVNSRSVSKPIPPVYAQKMPPVVKATAGMNVYQGGLLKSTEGGFSHN